MAYKGLKSVAVVLTASALTFTVATPVFADDAGQGSAAQSSTSGTQENAIYGVLTKDQLDRIVLEAAEGTAKGDQTNNVEDAQNRVAEPELGARKANYDIRKKYGDVSTLPSIDVQGVKDQGDYGVVRSYVTSDTSWPRTFAVVTQSGENENAQFAILTQENVRANYKISQISTVVPGQESLGQDKLKPTAVSWLGPDHTIESMGSPADVMNNFVKLLDGDKGVKKDYVDNKAVMKLVDNNSEISAGTELVKPVENTISNDNIKAFETESSFVVSGVVETAIEQKPKNGQIIKLDGDPPQKELEALTGRKEVSGNLKTTAQIYVTLVKDKETKKTEIISFTRSFIRAEAS